MSDYHAPRGAEATPKPLAVYRDRLANGFDPTEARMDLYQELYWKWAVMRRRRDLFIRHEDKIIRIARKEAERHGKRAA